MLTDLEKVKNLFDEMEIPYTWKTDGDEFKLSIRPKDNTKVYGDPNVICIYIFDINDKLINIELWE